MHNGSVSWIFTLPAPVPDCSYLQCMYTSITGRKFYRRQTRCRFRLQRPEGGFRRPSRMGPREGFDQTPLTVTRNRSFGTAGNVPASKVVNFTNCRCHAEFFHLKDTSNRPQLQPHNSPRPPNQPPTRHIAHYPPPSSNRIRSRVFLSESKHHRRLATAASKPLHRRSDRHLFLRIPLLLLSPPSRLAYS